MKQKLDGIFKQNEFKRFRDDIKKSIKKDTNEVFKTHGNAIKKDIQAYAKTKFKVKKQVFLKSFSYKIFDKKDTLPSMLIGSKIDFISAFEFGEVINAKRKFMLIPSGKKRIGVKTLKTLLSKLQSENRLKIIKKDSKILFFEVVNSTTKRGKNKERLKLIATAVKKVVIKKRLDLVSNITSKIKNLNDDLIKRFSKY